MSETKNPTLVDIISRIDTIQRESFQIIHKKVNEISLESLPTNRNGLYWIWTKLDNEKLIKYYEKDTEIIESKHVPIPRLVNLRKDFAHISQINHQGYRVIYNGIGGSTKKAFGLRERILQEFNAKNKKTGTLSLANRYKAEFLNRFAVSFFDLDADTEAVKDIINQLTDEYRSRPYLEKDLIEKQKQGKSTYDCFAHTIEIGWRLQFGVPILSRM